MLCLLSGGDNHLRNKTSQIFQLASLNCFYHHRGETGASCECSKAFISRHQHSLAITSTGFFMEVITALHQREYVKKRHGVWPS